MHIAHSFFMFPLPFSEVSTNDQICPLSFFLWLFSSQKNENTVQKLEINVHSMFQGYKFFFMQRFALSINTVFSQMLVEVFPLFIGSVEVIAKGHTEIWELCVYIFLLRSFTCPIRKTCPHSVEQAWYINFLRAAGEYLNELKA